MLSARNCSSSPPSWSARLRSAKSSVRSSSDLGQKHRHGNLAAFRRKDIEGPTRGGCIHHFETDSRLDERTSEPRMRKAHGAAGPEQRDLGREFSQRHEVGLRQLIEAAWGPTRHDAFGRDQKVVAILDDAESDETGAVAREHVALAGAEMEFHGCRTIAGAYCALRQVLNSARIITSTPATSLGRFRALTHAEGPAWLPQCRRSSRGSNAFLRTSSTSPTNSRWPRAAAART